MLTLPPIPSWQAIHPLIVHFPIALLLIAPLFIVIGVLWNPKRGFAFLLVALILMALGTVSTFVAASSGAAAGELAQNAPQVKVVLEQHEELAETTEIAFSALTLIFAAILFVPRLLRRERNARDFDDPSVGLSGLLRHGCHLAREHCTSGRPSRPRTWRESAAAAGCRCH